MVPIDFSDKNAAALTAAMDLADESGAQVTLLHVVESINDSDDEDFSDFYDRLKERSNSKLADKSASFSARGIAVQQQTLLGKPAVSIVRYAMEHAVDLIVMSSHRINRDEATGWGSTSYQVSILCQCAVLLVK